MAITPKLISNFKTQLKSKKNGEFSLEGEYLGSKVENTFKHLSCGYVWKTTPVSLLHSKGVGCPECKNNSRRTSDKEFKLKLLDKFNGKFTLSDGHRYHGSRTETSFRHTVCGRDFKTEPYLLLKSGSCKHCRGNRAGGIKKTHEDFVRELEVNKRGEYVLAEGSRYSSALAKVTVIHVVCNRPFTVRASHILHTSGCPYCNNSKGEQLVSLKLSGIGLTFRREVKFKECRNIKELPFDFAVYNENGDVTHLIEYDGVQHFIAYDHFGGIDKLKRTQLHDKIKDTFSKDSGIPLLRLPYSLSSEDIDIQLKEFFTREVTRQGTTT